MSLFKITVKQNRTSNGIRLEKGMSVDVSSKFTNPLTTNGGQEVIDAFSKVYSIDLKKCAGGAVSSLGAYLDIKKV